MGTSESSSEDDDEPPTEEAVKSARQLVVFNANQELGTDTETATALLQALVKTKFKFRTANGTEKTCGVDFIKQNITRTAKVRTKNRNKSSGKKSIPGHMSAQERDPDVLEIGLTNEECQMLKEPENPTTGPNGRSKDRRKGSKKEKVIPPKVADDGKRPEKKRKRINSSRTTGIKFYHEHNTEEARVARLDWASHQLLVHGLSRTPQGQRPPTAGPQEIN